MRWHRGAEDGPGDEPGPDFGPPRHGRHHDDQFHDDQFHDDQFHDDQFHDDESGGDPGSPGTGGPPGRGSTRRDGKLAGFAPGGKWEKQPPSVELATLLASLSGPEWRCPGASAEEMIGLAGRWAAVESWAAAAKLGVIRELIRREDRLWQPADSDVEVPDPWTESLTHNLALALAASAGSAERTEWLAWELGTRLAGIGALLADGTVTYGKAKAIAEAFQPLSDDHAAHAEAMIIGQLAGKTYRQVLHLAQLAACKADPEGAERRRKEAEKHSARVRLWREQSGTAALAGFDLPTDEALAAHDNVSARAEDYKRSGVFAGAKLDQLRAMAYLDLLNGVTAQARITNARTPAGPAGHPSPADSPGPAGPAAAGPADAAASQGTPDGVPDGSSDGDGSSDDGDSGDGDSDDGDSDDGDSDDGDSDDGDSGDGDSGDGDSGDGYRGGDPGGGGGGPDRGNPAAPSPSTGQRAAARPGTDLIIPLVTLLGRGNRPGEAHRLGPLDPALCRKLAALATASPATELCLTVTDHHGIAIGHGCARTRTRPSRETARSAAVALPARVNLTIPLTDLQTFTGPAGLAGHAGPARPAGRGSPADRGSPWALTPRPGDHGPPGGYGTWTLTIPGGREFTVRLEQVPVFDCDHARESRGYQPSAALRHLVQVRDGECTFPTCTRHARESDFEHAVPYHQGGRTCACNAGARSRKCHRIKQSKGWNVTQSQPGYHQWTTPTGHTYTQEPKRYPA